MPGTRQTTVPVEKDIVIIGAGASGLFCAAECGKRGRSVALLDHGERVGSKILVSGGGRCNFTNLNVTADNYLSENPHFCKSALSRFRPGDLLALMHRYGVKYYEKEAGQLFCAHGSRDMVSLLKAECDRAGVKVVLRCSVQRVEKEAVFTVTTDLGVFRSESLVVATGGLSYPALGASGFGFAVARQFGVRIIEPRPALVPLLFSARDQKVFRELAGVSLDVAVRCGGRRFRGSLLFTHRGVSGPAILQASNYWAPPQTLLLDLLPDIEGAAFLFEKRQSTMELRNLLARHLPKRFAQLWCDRYAVSKPIIQYSDKELNATGERLHAWEIRPAGTEGYGRAEVTAGGIDTAELSSKTMEAKKVPGLYFIGETVDVTGLLGGYNLHWAWASGFAAGQYA